MEHTRIKRMACYANLNKDEFEMIGPTINQGNLITMQRASFATSVVLMALTIASFSVAGLEKNKLLYLLTFLCNVVIYAVSKCLHKIRPGFILFLSYAFLSIAFLFAIILGVPKLPDSPATTFCVLLFALPLLIADRPVRMNLFLTAVTALLCVFSLAVKEPSIAMLDVVNGISFLFLSIVVNYLITKTKYHDTLMQCMAVNSYQKHLDSALKSNENTIATFHMNLTKNICGEGSTRYEDMMNLLTDNSVDSFFISTSNRIPNLEERASYQKFFNCKNLLSEFEKDHESVFMEHYFVLGDGKARWIKTTADMMVNPYSKDVEAVFYVYNINSEKVSSAIIAEVAAQDYDVIAFVYEEPEHYIFVDRENPRKAREGINFYEDTKADIIRDNPDNLEDILHMTEKQAVQKALEQQRIYTVFYTAHLENGMRARKKVRYINYSKHEKIMFVNKRDVTDVYEMEEKSKEELAEALVKAQKASAAKTEFLSNMSHDMRTPMNGILGIANLMKEKTDLNEIRDDIEQIQLSGQYLLRLINDTLDMNKIEAGKLELKPKPIQSEHVFRNVISQASLLAKDKKIDLIVHEPVRKQQEWVTVLADQSRLEQIFLNIISNSVKYTPEGGKIEIFMNNLSTTDEAVVDEYLIRDNGIGMSEEFLPHVFDSFSQEGRIGTEQLNGTGLGMAIVKQFVDMMHGDISIKSTVGKGTEVKIVLQYPRCRAVQDKEEEKQLDVSVLNGKHILLCEDHPLNRQIAATLLKKQGMLVTEAENGRIGVDLMQNSSENTFDAVLMDIRMPELDGIEATKIIRAMDRNDAKTIPIIAVTANAFEEDIKSCMEAGMNYHLTKPFEPKKLYEILIQKMHNHN